MVKFPKYKGLRLFIVAILLYYMLASPVIGMLYITNSTNFIDNKVLDSTRIHLRDSLIQAVKSSGGKVDSTKIIESLKKAGIEIDVDSLHQNETHLKANIKGGGQDRDITGSESLFLDGLLFSFILGFAFVIPHKLFFRRKRKGRYIPPKIELYVRKTILYSPMVLALIIAFPFILQNCNLFYHHFINDVFVESFQRKMSFQYWAIFLLAGFLTVAFVYYWQKHNVQILYIHHVFSREELKRRVFKSKSGRIGNRLVFTSFLTTLLPLIIVVAYILMSLTSLSRIGIKEPNQDEFKILLGEYNKINGDIWEFVKVINPRGLYINALNTILLFTGIGMGILVTIIYLLFFVRWTNSEIISPVKELLQNMQKTTAGQLENYSIVRTNDEIGDLSSNYNIMTSKLHEYISHIDKMNAELEQKVKDRTAEIQAQKEEIEAQRDEVESQRDEIERQRDYVVEQRDLIILQKKAITDSIEYAANIQSAILPPKMELDKIFPRYFIYFKPRDIVSGDFYWAHKIKEKDNNRAIVVAADSTGHGVPGALMSMLGITLLKEIVVKKEIYLPSEILDNLKEGVVNSLHQSDDFGKSKDGIDISVCMIDPDKRILEYAGAYNSIYIVRQIKSESQMEQLANIVSEKIKYDKYDNQVLIEIKADKNPIGISHKNNGNYTLHRINLEKNDVVYMFSDGYADQFGGKQRLKYLYSRFKMLLSRISTEPIEQQQIAIDKELTSWKGVEKQIDDILVIGIHIS